MATIVHDHRKHTADYPIPRGGWLHTKVAHFGMPRPQQVRSLAGIARLEHPAKHITEPVSTVAATGSQPKGFGITVDWKGSEDLALTAFVTASDQLGFAVSGVTDGDTFELVSAVGIATFAEETANEGIASIVTIVAAGANIAATAFGSPELVPLITAAGNAIAKAAPESQHAAKYRDAFGQDPGSGKFGREEGGLLICSPDALGTYTSGDEDHQSRWLKSDRDRSPVHWPGHVQHAFFLERDRQRRILDGDGEMIVCPWDYDFDDNTGSYRLDFILRRADRVPEPIG